MKKLLYWTTGSLLAFTSMSATALNISFPSTQMQVYLETDLGASYRNLIETADAPYTVGGTAGSPSYLTWAFIYGVDAGVAFNPNFAVEAGWYQFLQSSGIINITDPNGTVTTNNTVTLDSWFLYGALKGSAELPFIKGVSIFFKAGFSYDNNVTNVSVLSADDTALVSSSDFFAPLFGVGIGATMAGIMASIQWLYLPGYALSTATNFTQPESYLLTLDLGYALTI